jgi:hypothetical protein
MIVDLPDDLIAEIRKYAAQTARCDDENFDIDGHAGGQTDDAFYMGIEEGQIILAQEIASYFPEA